MHLSNFWKLAFVAFAAATSGWDVGAENNNDWNLSDASASALHVGAEVRDAFGFEGVSTTWFAGEKITEPPESVLREAYFARGHAMQCTDAADAFLNVEELRKLGNLVDEDTYYFALRRYVSDCLTTLQMLSDELGTYGGARPENASTFLTLLGSDGYEAFRSSLVFTPPSSGILCSGTLVWLPKNGSIALGIVTAAHCLGPISRDEQAAESGVIVNIAASIKFRNLDGKDLVITLPRAGSDIHYDGFSEDIAVVELLGNFDPQEIGVGIGFSLPDEWQHIYVVGQNRYLSEYYARRYYRSNAKIDLPPAHSTIVGMDTGCRAYGQWNSLLFHNCQTINGTSGGGVFVYSGGSLKLIAVHSGHEGVFSQLGVDYEDLKEVILKGNADNFATLLGLKNNN